MKRSLEPGAVVRHPRLGFGVVVEQWGAWVDTDELGNHLAMSGSGIYDVEFETHGRRSVSSDWLQLWAQLPADNKLEARRHKQPRVVLNAVC
jgi:hypothetical protein